MLLIQPSAGRFEKIGLRMPLGLLYVATFLKNNNVNCKIIDTRIDKHWKNKLRHILPNEKIVALTCMIGPQVKNALLIARYVKSIKLDIKVVMGGPLPTALPDSVLKEEFIDIVVRGEGEKPLLELALKKNISEIEGISYKLNGKQVHNHPQKLLDPEEIPIPDYDLIDMDKYSSTSYHGEKGLSVQASRGCPYQCSFCYNKNFNKGIWRPFPLKKVLENINILVNKYNAKTLYFVDDNAAVDSNRFLQLLKLIKSKYNNLNLAFQGIRVDTLEKFDENLFDTLYACGVRSMDIGIESFNDKYLQKIDKKLNTLQILNTLNRLESKPFNLKFNLIVGFPGQTKEEIDGDIKKALELTKKHKNSYVLLNAFRPLPGTSIYQEAIKAGFKIPESFEKWGDFAETSWMKKHSWQSKELREYIENSCFIFLFSNKNILSKVSNQLVKKIISFYIPFGKFRLKHNFYGFMVEKKLIEMLD